jgi:putative photosynthetic complex assembly protein 2
MSQIVLPAVFTLFAWWISTGVIIWLNRLPRSTYPVTFSVASGLAVLAFWGLATSRNMTTETGAYCAFSCALLIWAWQEIAFLLGYVTGPRRTDLPVGSRGWRRAGFALQVVLHHELALIALAAGVFAVTAGGSNRVGLCTFLIFWVMRQSAKLNIFLGVRNLSETFLPAHLRYLPTYFQRKPINPLFPIVVTFATAAAMAGWEFAWTHRAGGFQPVAATLASMLLSLAVLEHWFMVLPIPFERLWQWSMGAPVEPPGSARLGMEVT